MVEGEEERAEVNNGASDSPLADAVKGLATQRFSTHQELYDCVINLERLLKERDEVVGYKKRNIEDDQKGSSSNFNKRKKEDKKGNWSDFNKRKREDKKGNSSNFNHVKTNHFWKKDCRSQFIVNQFKGKGKTDRRKSCARCGKLSHMTKDCNFGKILRCFICREPFHKSYDCPQNKKNQKGNHGKPQATTETTGQSSHARRPPYLINQQDDCHSEAVVTDVSQDVESKEDDKSGNGKEMPCLDDGSSESPKLLKCPHNYESGSMNDMQGSLEKRIPIDASEKQVVSNALLKSNSGEEANHHAQSTDDMDKHESRCSSSRERSMSLSPGAECEDGNNRQEESPLVIHSKNPVITSKYKSGFTPYNWEPSVPYRPAFCISILGTPSSDMQYDPLRDSIEPQDVAQSSNFRDSFGSHTKFHSDIRDKNCYDRHKDVHLVEQESSATCASDVQNNNIIPNEEKPLVPDGNSELSSDLKVEKGRKMNELDEEQSKTRNYFRVALVEFMKELIRPIWHEGRLSKDVYKLVVQKAENKVMSTLQPNQVPNTSESVKQYMSSSRVKILKLIQAYVDMYSKC